MTLSAGAPKQQYSADGSTTSFPTVFKFLENGDIKVILKDSAGVETEWVEGTDYTLTGAGNANGGTVTSIATTPTVGETLTIKSNATEKQAISLPLGGALPSPDVEEGLDRATRLVQQVSEKLSRSLTLSEGTTASTDITMEDPETRKILGWNFDADAIINYSITNLSSSISSNVDTLLTSLTERDRLFYDVSAGAWVNKPPALLNVKDFGAAGDGSTDDTDAITSALSAAGLGLYFPAGTYLTDKITVPFANLSLIGEGSAVSILKLNASQNTDLINNSLADFSIKDMRLDGNGSNQSGTSHCMIFTAGIRTHLTDVEMTAGRTHNFLMIANTNSKLTRVRSYSSTAGTGGQIGQSGSTTTDHLLTDCVFESNLTHGLLIGKSGSTTRRVTIIGGIAETNGVFGHGYMFDSGLQNATVIGVTAHGNLGADGFSVRGARSVIFSGCLAYEQAQRVSVQGNGFGCTAESRSITYSGCISHTNDDSGFTVNKNVSFIDFIGCKGYNNGQDPVSNGSGIEFTSDSTPGGGLGSNKHNQIVIIGGNYYDDQGVATQNWGIEIISTPQDSLIANVMASGNITASIRDVVGDDRGVSITNVRGYNPVGNVAPPAMSSGTVQTNEYPHPVWVYLTGGTVSNIQVGGQSTGLTSGSFYVDVGDTIEVTYSGEPSWIWLGV